MLLLVLTIAFSQGQQITVDARDAGFHRHAQDVDRLIEIHDPGLDSFDGVDEQPDRKPIHGLQIPRVDALAAPVLPVTLSVTPEYYPAESHPPNSARSRPPATSRT
jgi:hypothetical protein